MEDERNHEIWKRQTHISTHFQFLKKNAFITTEHFILFIKINYKWQQALVFNKLVKQIKKGTNLLEYSHGILMKIIFQVNLFVTL